MMSHRSHKRFAALAIAGIVAASGAAFAAANTVPDTKAGYGSGAVSGMVVTNVAYHEYTSDPTKVDSVSFTADAAADAVKIRLVTATPGTWYTCTPTLLVYTCAIGTPITFASVNTLDVLAYETAP